MPDLKWQLAPSVDDFIRYEDGDMSPEQQTAFLQKLLDSGAWRTLQGAYGRAVMAAVQAGEIK